MFNDGNSLFLLKRLTFIVTVLSLFFGSQRALAWGSQDMACWVPSSCDDTISGNRATETMGCTSNCLEYHAKESPGCSNPEPACSAACRLLCEENGSTLGFNFETLTGAPPPTNPGAPLDPGMIRNGELLRGL